VWRGESGMWRGFWILSRACGIIGEGCCLGLLIDELGCWRDLMFLLIVLKG
jgi:hypothetical protein